MSLFGGMLASAVSGGANAVTQIADGKLEQQRREELAKALADIEVQKAQRVAEWNLKFETSDSTVAARTGAADKTARAAAATNRAVAVENENDAAYTAAKTAAGDREATDTARRTRDATKAAAGDKTYLDSLKAVTLADPRVEAQIKASAASAAASYASAAESTTRRGMLNIDKQIREQELKDRQTLTGLYDQQLAVLNDKGLSPEARAEKLKNLDAQAGLLAKRLGGGKSSGAAESDTVTIETTTMNPDGGSTKTTEKKTRKPGVDGGAAESDPIKAAMDAARASKDKPAARPGAAPAAPKPAAGPKLETITAADGKPVYRYSGQSRWYPSAAEAMAALGPTPQRDVAEPNMDAGY